jgi:hypothetical protein
LISFSRLMWNWHVMLSPWRDEWHPWLKLSKILNILLKMPGLQNTPLRANTVIHVFYKSLAYFLK